MIDEAAGFVCSREWVYTAISRARTLCLLIGKMGVVERQCKRVCLSRRKTFLKEMLTDGTDGQPDGQPGGRG
jgi:ATP-dependent exoDNAse (exonuclease V) alpha subunit